MDIDGEDMKHMNEELKISIKAEQNPYAIMHSDFLKGTIGDVLNTPTSSKDKVSESEVKAGG